MDKKELFGGTWEGGGEQSGGDSSQGPFEGDSTEGLTTRQRSLKVPRLRIGPLFPQQRAAEVFVRDEAYKTETGERKALPPKFATV